MPLSPLHWIGVEFGLAAPRVVLAKMASIEMALASTAAAHRYAADADSQRRLRELGIVDPAAIHLIASSEAGLRSAAAEILGDGFGNDAWSALLRAWQASTY